MKALTQAQKAHIAAVEAQIQASASDEDWYVEEAVANNNQVHQLKNGFTAQRNGELFSVMKDGVFVMNVIRLKVAKDYAKSHK